MVERGVEVAGQHPQDAGIGRRQRREVTRPVAHGPRGRRRGHGVDGGQLDVRSAGDRQPHRRLLEPAGHRAALHDRQPGPHRTGRRRHRSAPGREDVRVRQEVHRGRRRRARPRPAGSAPAPRGRRRRGGGPGRRRASGAPGPCAGSPSRSAAAPRRPGSPARGVGGGPAPPRRAPPRNRPTAARRQANARGRRRPAGAAPPAAAYGVNDIAGTQREPALGAGRPERGPHHPGQRGGDRQPAAADPGRDHRRHRSQRLRSDAGRRHTRRQAHVG